VLNIRKSAPNLTLRFDDAYSQALDRRWLHLLWRTAGFLFSPLMCVRRNSSCVKSVAACHRLPRNTVVPKLHTGTPPPVVKATTVETVFRPPYLQMSQRSVPSVPPEAMLLSLERKTGSAETAPLPNASCLTNIENIVSGLLRGLLCSMDALPLSGRSSGSPCLVSGSTSTIVLRSLGLSFTHWRN